MLLSSTNAYSITSPHFFHLVVGPKDKHLLHRANLLEFVDNIELHNEHCIQRAYTGDIVRYVTHMQHL